MKNLLSTPEVTQNYRLLYTHACTRTHARAHTRARTHPVIDHFFIKQISFYAMILMFDSDFRIIIGSYTRDLSFKMFCF